MTKIELIQLLEKVDDNAEIIMLDGEGNHLSISDMVKEKFVAILYLE